MLIEYGTITSRVLHCDPVEWQNVCFSLANPEGEAFFRPDFGFLSGLTSWFRHCGISVEGDLEPDWSQLHTELPANLLEGVVLRDYQETAIKKALCYKRGIVANCTGAGKTIEYAALVKLIGGKSVCVFDTTAAAEQMLIRLQEFGVENVGMIGGGRKVFDDHILVVSDSAFIRIAKSEPRFMQHLQQCDLLAFDEVHHLGNAKTWLQICLYCPAPYRIGLSATPYEDEWGISDLKLIGAIGPIIDFLPSKILRDRGFLAEPIAFMLPVAGELIDPVIENWTHIEKAAIVQHEYRNDLIVSMVQNIVKWDATAKILVSVRTRDHGLNLC